MDFPTQNSQSSQVHQVHQVHQVPKVFTHVFSWSYLKDPRAQARLAAKSLKFTPPLLDAQWYLGCLVRSQESQAVSGGVFGGDDMNDDIWMNRDDDRRSYMMIR